MMTLYDESDRGDGPEITHPPRLVRFELFGRGPLLWFSHKPVIMNRGIYLTYSAHSTYSLTSPVQSHLTFIFLSVYRNIAPHLSKRLKAQRFGTRFHNHQVRSLFLFTV